MRTTLIGVVTSDKNAKTRRVEVKRLFRHRKFGKIVRGRTVCHVHDPESRSRTGDRVEIAESRPHSKTKRWELIRVVQAAADVEVEAARTRESEFTEADLRKQRETPDSEPGENNVPSDETAADEPETGDA